MYGRSKISNPRLLVGCVDTKVPSKLSSPMVNIVITIQVEYTTGDACGWAFHPHGLFINMAVGCCLYIGHIAEIIRDCTTL